MDIIFNYVRSSANYVVPSANYVRSSANYVASSANYVASSGVKNIGEVSKKHFPYMGAGGDGQS